MNLLAIGGTAIAILVALLGLQTWRLDSAQDELAGERARFVAFTEQVRVAGERAEQAAKEQTAKNEELRKRKEKDHAKALASLDAQYAAFRLRVRAGNDATRSFLRASTADPGADSRVEYSRKVLDREITDAVRELREGFERLRGEVADDSEPYDRATEVARTARDWALRAGRP